MAAARCTLYKPEIIEEVRRRLRSLPEPRPAEITKLEIVRALVVDIEELQKNGHSIQAIAETISAVGVPLTRATLKTYLGKLRPTARRTKRQRSRTSARLASTMPEAAVRVFDKEGAVPERETRGVRRETRMARAGQSERNRESSSSAQRKGPPEANRQVMLEQLAETAGEMREATSKEVGGDAAGPIKVNRAQMLGERGENILESDGRAAIARKENSPEKPSVDRAVNPVIMPRQPGANVPEIQNRGAGGGKNKSSGYSVATKSSPEGAGQAAHRTSDTEIDQRGWTFIPREDSRDI